MTNAPQGLHAFLRAYYHMKSADWTGNSPFPLKAMTADELTSSPRTHHGAPKTMSETVAPEMPSAAEIAAASGYTTTNWAFIRRNISERDSRAACRAIVSD